MTSQAPAVRPPINAGGQVAALIPQNLDEAFRVANAIAASGLAPKGVDKPEQVLVAIMAGAELGFAPFQAMQSFAVINGKPNIWGDAIPALLWSKGFDIDEWFDDEDKPTKAFCKVTRPSGKEVERTFSVDDAKKANLLGKQGPWQTNQKRMLQMRARAFAARDGAADVLRGMQVYEEAVDFQPIRDVTPRTSGLSARLSATPAAAEGFDAAHVNRETGAAAEVIDHDEVTGEIIEGQAESADDDLFPGDKPAPTGAPPLTERIEGFKAAVLAQTDLPNMAKAWRLSTKLRAEIDAADPDDVGTSAQLEEWFNGVYAEREDAERAAQ